MYGQQCNKKSVQVKACADLGAVRAFDFNTGFIHPIHSTAGGRFSCNTSGVVHISHLCHCCAGSTCWAADLFPLHKVMPGQWFNTYRSNMTKVSCTDLRYNCSMMSSYTYWDMFTRAESSSHGKIQHIGTCLHHHHLCCAGQNRSHKACMHTVNCMPRRPLSLK